MIPASPMVESATDPHASMINLCSQNADSAADSSPSLGGASEIFDESDPHSMFSGGCRVIILPRKLFSSRQLAELGVLHTPPENPSHLNLSTSEDQNLEEFGGDPGNSKKVRSYEGGSDDEPERKKSRVLEEEIGGVLVNVGGTDAASVEMEGSTEEGLDVETVDLGEGLGGETGEVEMLERRVFEEEEIGDIDQILEITRTCGKKDILDENDESMDMRESMVDGGPTEAENALEDSGKDILDELIEMSKSSIGRNEGKRPLEDQVKDIVEENIGLMEMRESIVHEGANKGKRPLEDSEKDVVDQSIGLVEIYESTVGGNEGKKRDRETDILEDKAELMKIYKSWLARNEGKMHLEDGEKDIPVKKMKGICCESSMNVGTNKGKTPLEYSEKHKLQESMKEGNASVALKTGTLLEYMEALRVVYASHGYNKYDDDDDDDILETAKKLGMTFPRPRWRPP